MANSTEGNPMSQPLNSPLLLTPEQAADRLNVGRTMLYALLDSGEIESVKIGRLRRIPPDALIAYIEQLRTESGRQDTGEQP